MSKFNRTKEFLLLTNYLSFVKIYSVIGSGVDDAAPTVGTTLFFILFLDFIPDTLSRGNE